MAAFCAKRFWRLDRVEVEDISSIDQRITLLFHHYLIPTVIYKMPVRLIGLPVALRSQLLETCLPKRNFSISSKVSGHENPLVSGKPDDIKSNKSTSFLQQEPLKPIP